MIKAKNLKSDVIFKAFFSRKGNEKYLIDFLNALLGINIKKITIREEVSIEQLSEKEKGGRLDLQAELNDGIIVNIELQMRDEHNILERTTFYGAKVMAREIGKGTKYKEIGKVIMINILNYNLFDFNEYLSETVTVLDKHREHEVMDSIKYYFLELPKFRKQLPNINNKLNQWIYFIDNTNKEMIEMIKQKNSTIAKAAYDIGYLTAEAAERRMEELEENGQLIGALPNIM